MRGGIPLRGWTNSLKGVMVGVVTGTSLGLLGFWLVNIPGTHAMGLTLFILTPFAAGFAIEMVSESEWNRAIASALISLLVSMTILIFLGLETSLCAVTAFPLVFGALMIGALLGMLVRKMIAEYKGENGKFTAIALLSLPFLIFASHRMELPTLLHSRQEVITTSIRLTAEPSVVWANLRSFDSVRADKTFLMYVGLPIPERCTMEGSGVGATRTCYFNKGYIKETVMEWQPPFVMGLNVDRTNLPGRHWLGFENARYELRADGSGTVLTRSTTVTSYLYPAWYWRPFESWGVSSEHRYIFEDIARRVQSPRTN